MEFQSIDYTIDTLLQRIRTSRLALPDFQREFVWKPNEVVELLDSVARQWPIGALLLLSGPQPFATKEIESGPSVSETELESYILDGQQRVTSLYHAIMDVSEYCYYVNFSDLSLQNGEHINWERRDRFLKKYPTTEERAANKIALIREIWDSQSFFKWTEHLKNDAEKFEYFTLRDNYLGGLQTKVYKVMAIELQQEISLEALARIFETLNRTGVRLNAFDLMVAALYPSGFKLKEEWDTAANNNPIFNEIKPDAIEILKLCSLRIRYHEGRLASAGVRQGDLLKIDRKLIIRYWKPSLELYVRALEYCKENFGILNTELVPSWSLVLGIAGLLETKSHTDLQIRNWWIHRVTTQYFAQAANTRIVSDFGAINSQEFDLGVSSDELSNFDEPTKKNGLLAKALAGMLIKFGARDPITGDMFTEKSNIVFRGLSPDGTTHRLTSEDTLLETIIVTEKTDRILGKHASLYDSPNYLESLESQGISEGMKRSKTFLAKIFSVENRENAK